MTNTFWDRANEVGGEMADMVIKLTQAGIEAGYEDAEIDAAVQWASCQLDFEEDDYETWEATVLARLEDPDGTGER